MRNRLTRITTRTGDDGSTGLGDGQRVRKNAARIIVIGDIDELNSTLGVLLAESLPRPVRDGLLQVQHDLFDLGGELAIPGRVAISDAHVARLDQAIADANAALPPLREFILPGGTRAAALAHVSRTVCRRAERALITLADAEEGGVTDVTTVNEVSDADASAFSAPSTPTVSVASRRYLNRLSDLLFILAREINRSADVADVYWRTARSEAS